SRFIFSKLLNPAFSEVSFLNLGQSFALPSKKGSSRSVVRLYKYYHSCYSSLTLQLLTALTTES
uniref:Uncharacterized protein n=1 Tax=Anopheles quadriannulatus TaxID=34691 RepID=A0A182XQ82_ANOQN